MIPTTTCNESVNLGGLGQPLHGRSALTAPQLCQRKPDTKQHKGNTGIRHQLPRKGHSKNHAKQPDASRSEPLDRQGPALEQFILIEQQFNFQVGSVTLHHHKHKAQRDKPNTEEYEHIAQLVKRYEFEVQCKITVGQPSEHAARHYPHWVNVNQDYDQKCSTDEDCVGRIQSEAPTPYVMGMPDPPRPNGISPLVGGYVFQNYMNLV